MATRIQLRRGNGDEWESANPVLAAGEPGVDLDASDLRVGDGVRPWSELPGLPYVRAATLDLPTPAYLAHRGGAAVAPEETMEAYRTAVANGADVLEMDCQSLGDGALALMHDTTVDRTTDGTGNVADYTAPSWRALNAAAKFPWNGRVVPPALLSEVVAEFGGKTALMIEPKDSADAARVMDACHAAGITGSVILAASDLAGLQAAKAAGFACYYWWGTTVSGPVDIPTAVANGADYLGIDGVNAADAVVSSLVDSGLPVYAYTVNRRVDAARLTALGVAGFLTDQPAYLAGSTAQRKTDSWRQGVFGHGLGPATGSHDNMTVVSGALRITAAGFSSAVVGEVCPLTDTGTYTVDVDMGFSTMPASGGSATLVFARPDDKRKSLEIASGYPNGYLVLMRATGGLSLYRLTDNTTAVTQLGVTVTTAPLTAGGFAHIRVAVTPTTLTVTRTDGTPATIGPVTDSTYRGGYLAVGKKDVQDGVPHFRALVIT